LFWLSLLAAFSVCWCVDPVRLTDLVRQHRLESENWALKREEMDRQLTAAQRQSSALQRTLNQQAKMLAIPDLLSRPGEPIDDEP
jgi:hypothetical protein